MATNVDIMDIDCTVNIEKQIGAGFCVNKDCFNPTDSDVGMTTVNRCLDAAKACNIDDVCQKLRTEYVSTCIKPSTKSGLCNRSRCNKALRRFFDRVPPEYTHELLFCPCSDMACSERRRQTIVPSCSYEEEEKPSCLSQMRICKADYVCRSVSDVLCELWD